MKTIGLIAGRGNFPLLFSQEAQKTKTHKLFIVAIRGETRPQIKKIAEKVSWIDVWDFEGLLERFRKEGVQEIAMAGQVHPRYLFNAKVLANSRFKAILEKLQDRKADTIFGAIAAELEKEGFSIINSTTFVQDYLPKKGVLTKKEPDFQQWEDIYFGLAMAKYIAGVDIGQTVAVKHKTVLAVEALEGTDMTIQRAGRLSKGQAVIVKVSKPKQDLRFDIPVVGLNTIKNLVKTKASCLAFEAEKTLFLDRDVSLRIANSNEICIVAV